MKENNQVVHSRGCGGGFSWCRGLQHVIHTPTESGMQSFNRTWALNYAVLVEGLLSVSFTGSPPKRQDRFKSGPDQATCGVEIFLHDSAMFAGLQSEMGRGRKVLALLQTSMEPHTTLFKKYRHVYSALLVFFAGWGPSRLPGNRSW